MQPNNPTPPETGRFEPLSDMERKLLADAAQRNICIHPLHSRVLTLEGLKRKGLLKLVRAEATEYEYALATPPPAGDCEAG